jgi:hypothetical protein
LIYLGTIKAAPIPERIGGNRKLIENCLLQPKAAGLP